MARLRTLAAFAAALLVPAGASATTVTDHVITSPSRLITCYETMVVAGSGVNCSATYLTAPAGEGDPYLGLHPHGHAKLARRSDYAGYPFKHPTVLHYGSTWKPRGVTCAIATSGLTCRNLDGHGFHLAKGAVRLF